MDFVFFFGYKSLKLKMKGAVTCFVISRRKGRRGVGGPRKC